MGRGSGRKTFANLVREPAAARAGVNLTESARETRSGPVNAGADGLTDALANEALDIAIAHGRSGVLVNRNWYGLRH